MNEPYSCISRMEGLEIRNPEITLIRSKAGISLYRVTAQGRRLVLKVFEKQEDAREIENYQILSRLDIPTLPLLGYTGNAILLPDVEVEEEYRLGRESDLSDPQVAGAIAKWYRTLHIKGREYLSGKGSSLGKERSMYDESDAITLENMRLVARETGSADNALWKVIAENYHAIRSRIDALPRTLTYNDFYWTNLIVAKNGKSAFMFDYNLLGKGIAYGDVRNVTCSLSQKAAEIFMREYGEDIPAEQKKADAFIAPLVTLHAACEEEVFPSWAEGALSELKNGSILRSLKEWK